VRKLEEDIKAVVQKIIPEGDHGPFVVATSESIDGSITFSLEPTVWKEDEWPEQGMIVVLGKLRKKRSGWRAKEGRFLKPSDEQIENPERRKEMEREKKTEVEVAVEEHEMSAVESLPMDIFLVLIMFIDMSEKTPNVFNALVACVRDRSYRLNPEFVSVVSKRGIDVKDGIVVDDSVISAIDNHPNLDRVLLVMKHHGKECLEGRRG